MTLLDFVNQGPFCLPIKRLYLLVKKRNLMYTELDKGKRESVPFYVFIKTQNYIE